MIVEAFLVFGLEHPFHKLPNFAIKTSMIIQASYTSKEGLKTSVDEPAHYIAAIYRIRDKVMRFCFRDQFFGFARYPLVI